MSETAQPLVYVILGASGSGRREVLADFVNDAMDDDERSLVLLADTEAPDERDAKLGELFRWSWRETGGGPEGRDGSIATTDEMSARVAAATHVFFVTDGRRNPVEQVEALKPWLVEVGGELARILCVVNCQLAEAHRELGAWYEACIHFSDVVLLTKREGVANKWMSDFQERFKKLYYPCVFEFVKNGRVKNPALVLVPEARRMSHHFDGPEWETVDGEDIETGVESDEGEVEPDSEDVEIVEKVDPYFERRAGGQRVKVIPDIRKFIE
ncbi:hypothetical protein OH491_01105 [Termitidicoccus mucosus]|uniref:CobW/HypB/UreG nucleotide-binding domain-containing protein n=1 Tax=Termitidicoccus mucosus TaxID=1184151 RepID=A0A178IDB5_9BACT|nr:hypothetical protein AW736_24260 [Opitutaceae bacterium TSB47]